MLPTADTAGGGGQETEGRQGPPLSLTTGVPLMPTEGEPHRLELFALGDVMELPFPHLCWNRMCVPYLYDLGSKFGLKLDDGVALCPCCPDPLFRVRTQARSLAWRRLDSDLALAKHY